MSFYNVRNEADVISVAANMGNEIAKVLEYLGKESGWLRIEKLTDIWLVGRRQPDNSQAKWECRQVGIYVPRLNDIFIGNMAVNPYVNHDTEFSGVALGILQAVDPLLYKEVIEVLPPPTQW